MTRLTGHVGVWTKVSMVWVDLLAVVSRRDGAVHWLTADDEGPIAYRRSISWWGRRHWGTTACWVPVHNERRWAIMAGWWRMRVEGRMIFGIWHPAEHDGWTWEPATRRDDLLVVLGTTVLWETVIASSAVRISATVRPAALPSSRAVAVARRQRTIV